MNFDALQGDAESARVSDHPIKHSEHDLDAGNSQFANNVSAQIVLSVGVNLLKLAQDASTLQTLANLVSAFFRRELGRDGGNGSNNDHFNSNNESASAGNAAIDAAALSRELKHVVVDPPTRRCTCSLNIGVLAAELNLTAVENKLLAWCFAAAYSDRAERLDDIARKLRFSDSEHKYALLATLLEEPLDDVKSAFASGRLVALQLVQPRSWHQAEHLSAVLAATLDCLWMLQIRHRSRRAQMIFVLEPDVECALLADPTTPSELIRKCFPASIAEVYERTIKQKPMRAVDIASVLYWCAARELPAAHLEPLAGKLGFTAMRQAIQLRFVDCSKANVATTDFKLLQALYAAAA